MIVPMIKYDLVLFRDQKEDFLNKLQDLGLVDITVTGWEPGDEERALMASIDSHRTAVARLKTLSKTEGFAPGRQYKDGEEAFKAYLEAASKADDLSAQIVRAQKEAEELEVWGEFDGEAIAELKKQRIELRYFHTYTKEFEQNLPEWSTMYTIEPISESAGVTYFVVVTAPGQEISINAQEVKAVTVTYKEKEQEVAELEKERAGWMEILGRCAASIDLIAAHGDRAREQLQFSQAANMGRAEAEGTLVVMEGWATRETAGKVDALLEEYPNLLYLKSNPTPEDNTPVKLRNNRFARLFEFIGNFYSLPKYGSMDLTPYFAPFYMLFFGFCLADAGYGLVLFLGGLYLLLKGGPLLSGISKLTMLCGGATIVFGLLVGSFFGIQLSSIPALVKVHKYFLTTNNLFTLALAVGIIQILFGMLLKVINTTHQFGFRYALSTIGWMLVILSGLAAFLLPDMGVEGFSTHSPAFLVLIGTGLFMMLFLNSPGKNPFINFGAGLWNTYNDVTGLLGDVLSYIRLFAIGLSGGILALVFNDLALGLSPDIPVVRQIVILIILLIGHGINLFMSTLSSFVHPMRLTFVEFYKNAGFDASQRAFNPLKRLNKE